ncbi:chemotaxis protein CheA [Chromobacterium sp. IIBBL 290-4]|uniref:chemotaxis protein CheA n=1 Tax=Chromobacterium sp. IIBBL 290-4 TaxID=2953890 RepID=UPI0020B86892|nr:chemotaxis protein CheA [Chromobacterium sp. IIBBL 290-4]UTH75046.1 chemotaxis protein CheA [Chromobacterium sp. IIBBL 290-4]
MDLEKAKQTFLEEARELLDEMERILLDVEAEHADSEQLNALFRTMHTIKGSAGLFGLDEIVGFTHQAENLLDLLREGAMTLDDGLIGLLLRCHDHVSALIQALADGRNLQDLRDEALLADLIRQLRPDAPPPRQETSLPCPDESASEAAGNVETHWLLSLRFGPDVLRNGLDPSSFIRYLATLGSIEQIEAIDSCLPAGEAFDAESNYLRIEAHYLSDISEQSLNEVFEFVREDSELHIFPLPLAAAHFPEATASASQDEADAVRRAWLGFGALGPTEEEPLEYDPALAEPQETARAELPEAVYTEPTAPPPQTESRSETAHIADSPAAVETKPSKTTESKFIKVEASKLDNLIDLIGELVIAGAAANLTARRSQQTALVEATQTIANLIEQIRTGTLSMRMVQIGEIFHRFPRVARDVSRELGKDIQLHIVGAETELDKSMVEKLADPLLHIVRNAIDHGIEPTHIREAHGKPAAGNIWLNAYHESGSVVIEVLDDGGGLDKERILSKARQRGLVGENEILPDRDIFQLIFEAGFSTAEKITNLSGRGVGMDVVHRSIEHLRGSIDIDSEPGKGTAFRIRLPLTLAIIDGFLVDVSHSTFVLPLESVVECIEMPSGLKENSIHDCINLRGELLPLLHLNRFFELPPLPVKRRNVVVTQYGEHKAGLVVDALQGEFQTVIKPLGAMFSSLKALSGSTILGTGEVALILDVPSLIQHACRREQFRFTSLAGGAGLPRHDNSEESSP